MHGPIGCAGSSWDNRGTRSSGPDTFRIGMTTDLSDMDVIMGRGEKRLFKSIRQAVETHKPAAVFVYNTCVPALQGDDIEAVAKAAEESSACRSCRSIAPASTATRISATASRGDAVYKHIIGTREPDPVRRSWKFPASNATTSI